MPSFFCGLTNGGIVFFCRSPRYNCCADGSRNPAQDSGAGAGREEGEAAERAAYLRVAGASRLGEGKS